MIKYTHMPHDEMLEIFESECASIQGVFNNKIECIEEAKNLALHNQTPQKVYRVEFVEIGTASTPEDATFVPVTKTKKGK